MNDETDIGRNKSKVLAAKHIGNGISWFGFWIFLGLASLDISNTATTIMDGATAVFSECQSQE